MPFSQDKLLSDLIINLYQFYSTPIAEESLSEDHQTYTAPDDIKKNLLGSSEEYCTTVDVFTLRFRHRPGAGLG